MFCSKLNDKNLRLGTETTSGSQEDLVDTHMTNGFSGANLQHLKADKEKLEKKCSGMKIQKHQSLAGDTLCILTELINRCIHFGEGVQFLKPLLQFDRILRTCFFYILTKNRLRCS